MAKHRTTTTPAVSPAWRKVVKQLRNAGCTFEHSNSTGTRVYAPDGTYSGYMLPRPSRGSSQLSAADKALLRAFIALGWYNPVRHKATGPTTKEAPSETVGLQLMQGRVAVAAPGGRQLMAATGGGSNVVRLPVRARTAHQHRLDNVRHRVLRVLHELGGNTAAVRTDFCKDVLAEAVKHGLRVPNPAGGPDRDKRIVGSMHQSLRNLLGGKGQTDWMLDVWELSCALLEMPLGNTGAPATLAKDEPIVARHATVAPTVAAPAQPAEGKVARAYTRSSGTVGVQPFADEPNGGATGATVGQHNDDDDRLRIEVGTTLRAKDDMPGLGRHYDAMAAELDAVLADPNGVVAAQRKQYLQALQEAALAGDDRAATRLEGLLGL